MYNQAKAAGLSETARDSSEVEYFQKELHSQIVACEGLFEGLVEKLHPVLPSNPTPEKIITQDRPLARPATVQVTIEIREQTDRLIKLAERIAILTRSLPF